MVQIYLNTAKLTPEITTVLFENLNNPDHWAIEEKIKLIKPLLLRMHSQSYTAVKELLKALIQGIVDTEELNEGSRNEKTKLLKYLFSKELQIGDKRINNELKKTPNGLPAYNKVKIRTLAN